MTALGTFVRRNFEPLVLSVQVVVDLLVVVLACLTAWWVREGLAGPDIATPLASYREVFSIATAVCLVSFHWSGMYSPSKSLLNVEEYAAVTKASVAAFFVLFALLVFLRGTSVDESETQAKFYEPILALHRLIDLEYNPDALSRVTLLLAFVFVLIFTTLSRFVSFRFIQRLHRRGIGNRNVIVIGAGATGQKLQEKFLHVPTLGLNFVGFVDDTRPPGALVGHHRVLGSSSELELLLARHKVSEVFVALPEAEEADVMDLVARLDALLVPYYVVPRFYHLLSYNVRIENLDSIPLITRSERRDSLLSAVIKRSFDVCVSLIVLLLTAPLFAVVALLIKRQSPGPVFFMQERIGKDGRPFRMIKFRTMHMDQCGDAVAPRNESDPRITRIGRYLRRYSLDELPNFINVLLGDMSVVGPRPEMRFIVDTYRPMDRERLRAKPGVTGLWQISYARQDAIHANIDYDLYYIENQSFLLDLVIVALTGFAVAKGTGAW
ncbi:MAG: sugar transferase [Planctomycetota bacterium]